MDVTALKRNKKKDGKRKLKEREEKNRKVKKTFSFL